MKFEETGLVGGKTIPEDAIKLKNKSRVFKPLSCFY